MPSVTQRIKQIHQPYGGYLPIKSFTITELFDFVLLYDDENIQPSIVGLAVDYLTRFMVSGNVRSSFDISLLGARIVNKIAEAESLLKNIKGLDDCSIINACALVCFDVYYRVGIPFDERPILPPNEHTIHNIRVMVKRGLYFWDNYGPVVVDGFTFPGGYTDTVSAGDGDFLTSDTLWDFKVSKYNPTSSHTLQILMYYIMGIHSSNPAFKNIKNLGIFNPKLNNVYRISVDSIPQFTIATVEKYIIGYESVQQKQVDEGVPNIGAKAPSEGQHGQRKSLIRFILKLFKQ